MAADPEVSGGRPVHDPWRCGGLPVMGRPEFLAAAGVLPALWAFSRGPRAAFAGDAAPRRDRLFFTSQGKTALVNADGSGLRYLQFDRPGQATWQPTATF